MLEMVAKGTRPLATSNMQLKRVCSRQKLIAVYVNLAPIKNKHTWENDTCNSAVHLLASVPKL